MKSLQRIVLLLLAGAVSTGASARDTLLSPVSPRVSGWDGFYAGLHTGRVNGDFLFDPGFPFEFSPKGNAHGVQIGYWKHLTRNFVFGYEADVSFADADASDFFGQSVRLRRFGTARTRIGYATGPFLFYGTAGAAWAQYTGDFSVIPMTTRQAFVGWAAGAGVEIALAGNWSLKAEYLRIDLRSNNELVIGPLSQSGEFDTVRVGLNYRFAHLRDSPAAALAYNGGRPLARNTWTGAYIGFHGGFAWGQQTMDYAGGRVDFEPYGGYAGIQAGFNKQFERLVLGIESDLSAGSIDGYFLAACCTVKIERFGTVRLRAGFTFDRVLVFATGGAVWTTKTDNSYFSGFFTSNRPMLGVAGGVGIEYALSPLWSVKIEYLRLNFGETQSDYTGLTQFNEKAEFDTVRFGLNYRASLFEIFMRH